MTNATSIEQEAAELRKSIANLETQIKGLREYVATQERNLRTAPDAVRDITERGLAEARSDLSLKELRLQQERQDLQSKQVVLGKLSEVKRKQQDIETLERERDRINRLLDQARIDVQRLNQEYIALTGRRNDTIWALSFASGQQIPLASDRAELLVGCADPSVFPDVDLTPFGGTASGVSRRHALLRHNQGTWTITDLNSTNGTFVNGTRIASNMPTPLPDHAAVRFGTIDATFSAQASVPNKTTRFT